MRWPQANPLDPFFVAGPALISFSGGRTSAYMLYRILCAHGGVLPDDVKVAFANTGKEVKETYDFVAECSARWGVYIVCLEYDITEKHNTAIVSLDRCSRDGEPFAMLISIRKMLPNPTMRFCTIEMKIRRFREYCVHWLGWSHWTSVVGLRADEMHRVTKQRKRNKAGKDLWQTEMPLADAGITKAIIKAFWDAQPFDLQLQNVNGKTPDGNCDCCFLKSVPAIKSVMRRRPTAADFWIDAETNAPGLGTMNNPEMALFRADRDSYALMASQVERQGDLYAVEAGDEGSDDADCNCTD